MSIRAVVQGIGHAVPPRIVTNHDFELLVETNDEWIRQRTGIEERRVSSADETSATLASEAARNALIHAGIDAEDVELVVVGTVTGDMAFPSTACLVQHSVGARNAGAFDLGAACAGFIYSAQVAAAQIEAGHIRTALVVGVDTLTKFMDWSDRSTCVLFGDGAGAMVLRAEENTERGIIKTVLMADGGGAAHIRIDAGGSKFPRSNPKFHDAQGTIYMAGPEVYRFAVEAMGDACCKLLDLAGYEAKDIDLFVPHQANLRIIESAAKRLGLSDDRVFVNVNKYGNTSGGSIPIALSEAVETGRLERGNLVMTVGFGAGLVWGANLIRW